MLSILLTYLLFLLIVFLLQRKMIYFPTQYSINISNSWPIKPT